MEFSMCSLQSFDVSLLAFSFLLLYRICKECMGVSMIFTRGQIPLAFYAIWRHTFLFFSVVLLIRSVWKHYAGRNVMIFTANVVVFSFSTWYNRDLTGDSASVNGSALFSEMTNSILWKVLIGNVWKRYVGWTSDVLYYALLSFALLLGGNLTKDSASRRQVRSVRKWCAILSSQ